jgi:hypothetical protein
MTIDDQGCNVPVGGQARGLSLLIWEDRYETCPYRIPIFPMGCHNSSKPEWRLPQVVMAPGAGRSPS